MESNLFSPFRTLGLVTGNLPFQLNRLGKENFIITSIGNGFKIYNGDDLKVVLVSDSLPEIKNFQNIVVLPGNDSITFTSSGKTIYQWQRAKVICHWQNEYNNKKKNVTIVEKGLLNVDDDEDISILFPISDGKQLLSVIKNIVYFWNVEKKIITQNDNKELLFSLELDKIEMNPITCIMHPHTYLNKILICGGSKGMMQLWNTRTRKLIYTFPGWNSPIKIVEQSPAVDVVAIGLEDGRIIVHNLRFDKEICVFKHESNGTSSSSSSSSALSTKTVENNNNNNSKLSITSISFRTDANGITLGSNTSEMLVSGDEQGNIAIWDLESKSLISFMENEHYGPISKLCFLPGEPILISSGSKDNCLKMWIFDQSTGIPRLLKHREGHHAPPCKIRYYPLGSVVSTLTSGADATCCQILSAGSDRSLRIFHTSREQQNTELSQKTFKKYSSAFGVEPDSLKLPVVTGLVAIESREKDWCNVLTCHRKDCSAYGWSINAKSIGKYALRPDASHGLSGIPITQVLTDKLATNRTKQFPNATSVAISICGNFAIVGTDSGITYKYNMESGLVRGRYPSLQHEQQQQPVVTTPGDVSSSSSTTTTVVEEEEENYKNLSEAEKKRERLRLAPGSIFAFAGTLAKKQKTNLNINDTVASNKIDSSSLKHKGKVSGVGVTSLNQYVVTAGYDGKVKFWNFNTGTHAHTTALSSACSQLEMSHGFNLIAVSCDDFSVFILDSTTFNIVRHFQNAHKSRITDLCFSGNSRWLFTSSMDCCVKVFDLPSGKCVDWIQFDQAVTSLTFSPTGEYLATTHVDSLGISLWANKAHFGQAVVDKVARFPLKMSLSPEYFETKKDHKKKISSSSSSSSSSSDKEEELKSFGKDKEEIFLINSMGMIHLSGQPSSRWYTLAHLEIIKERNKPIEPPKKPEQAPFFLPSSTGSGSDSSFFASSSINFFEGNGNPSDIGGTEANNDVKLATINSKIIQGLSKPHSKLIKVLETNHAKACLLLSNSMKLSSSEADKQSNNITKEEALQLSGLYEPFVEQLGLISPSSIDFELGMMCTGSDDEDGCRLISIWLDFFITQLKSGKNYELVQAILSRLLALQIDTLKQRPELLEKLKQVRNVQKETWKRLNELLQQNSCLVNLYLQS